ncbi:hypothetical protein TNCV_2539391 [Trichonephila clavipes]|nr:hypothetical protein TNCV_2539391 [Trichonephila clavipes]
MSSRLLPLKTRNTERDPIPLKTLRVGERSTLNMLRLALSLLGVVWSLGEGDARSGVVLVTCPWFIILKFITNSSRAAL